MARLLAIDYGRKRTGIAVSDPLKLIATPLDTVSSAQVFDFLKSYLAREEVEKIIVGYPLTLKNEASEALIYVNPFLKKLQKEFPTIPVVTFDERFTSKMAFQSMIDGGLKKKQRQDKAMVDKISATIILQSYMESSP